MDETPLMPKQARSRESQQRILEATLALLEDRHFESMTIADIAEHAEMAVGNFYKRFKNKEALLPHLYAEYNRRFASFAQEFQGAPSDDPWRIVVRGTVKFFVANRGLIRALHLHSRLNPALVPEGSTEDRAKLYHSLEPLVTQPGLSSRARQRRARLAALAMVSSITEAILYPDMTPGVATGLSQSQLVDELSGMLASYCS